ncbi:putative oxidoreductase SadH [Micromonospora sp. MW-13]|uniref:SDR family oxidoreductase n=1 Tax=Micromonospora sp. MW-13 TaxID=2094022 RepID=UPI000E4403EC|nr:SDR family oxidoreductase [Micromonospora sp. MW-13]RGC65311.1 putative oxidoreductase SadH [Micromonospora sp. MW-13]
MGRDRRDAQVAVVTGASAGVGRATVRLLAERGIAVALLARGRVGLDAAAAEVRACGGRPLPIEVDVADYAQVAAAGEQIEAELGPIDLWINDAFSSVFAPFQQTRPEEFRRATEVTYLGYVHGTRVALSYMTPRNRGTIVQVSSALAYRGIPLQATYCGAKHAIVGFTEALRCELMHDRSDVKVTMVHLPALNTPQFDWLLSRLPRHAEPVPPIYDPVVAARAIAAAAERPHRRAYWVGMPTALTILGNRIAPGLLDHYLARTGYGSQQTDQPADPNRPDNLWQPLDGPGGRDYGARGSFTDRSHGHSPQAWLSRHRVLTTAGTIAAALGLLAWRRHRPVPAPNTRS